MQTWNAHRYGAQLDRCDKGRPRARKFGTVRAWQAATGLALQRLAGAAGPVDIDAVKKRAREAAGDCWTDQMDAEMDFLAKRRFVDKLERVLMGTALPSEIDATTKQEAAALHNLQLHQRRERVKMERRAAPQTNAPLNLDGVPIYFHKLDCVDAGAGYVRVLTRDDADVIVVANPATPPRPLLWWAMLCGKCVATPTYVKTSGASGCSIRYKGCIRSTPRALFVSEVLISVMKKDEHECQ